MQPFELKKLLHEQLIEYSVICSCLNCNNWNEEKEICEKYNSKPPAKIIVYGCEEWNYITPF